MTHKIIVPSPDGHGYAMAYAEAGAGAPVVMLHGTLGDQRYWAPQMAPLGERFRAIAPSLRHYWPERWAGPTAAAPSGFTIAQHVADVAAFITALGAGPVRLVGHSRGGHIAFRVAEQYPALLHSLVLAEPGGERDETLGGAPVTSGQGRQAAAFAAAATLVRNGDIEGGLRLVAEHTGGPGAWDSRTEDRKAINRDNAATLLGQIHEQRAPFSRAAAEAIRLPTLLVGGARTLPAFVANLDALERTIVGARRVTIPDAAHCMSDDNPAAFNAAVLEFLRA